MNAEELGRNKRLTSFFLRDLNKQPEGWGDGAERSFDAVVCCVRCAGQGPHAGTRTILLCMWSAGLWVPGCCTAKKMGFSCKKRNGTVSQWRRNQPQKAHLVCSMTPQCAVHAAARARFRRDLSVSPHSGRTCTQRACTHTNTQTPLRPTRAGCSSPGAYASSPSPTASSTARSHSRRLS
jgi:hypothetical protein